MGEVSSVSLSYFLHGIAPSYLSLLGQSDNLPKNTHVPHADSFMLSLLRGDDCEFNLSSLLLQEIRYSLLVALMIYAPRINVEKALVI